MIYPNDKKNNEVLALGPNPLRTRGPSSFFPMDIGGGTVGGTGRRPRECSWDGVWKKMHQAEVFLGGPGEREGYPPTTLVGGLG